MENTKITEEIFLQRFSKSRHFNNIKIIGKYNGYGKRIACKCSIDGYEWNPFAYNIACGSGCPVCNNDVVLIGINDLWTTHPKIAKLLSDSNDGYKITYGSTKKVNWICPDCGKPRIDTPNNVKKYGIRCKNCNDNFSFPNKIVYNLLWQIEQDFYSEKSFNFSINKNGNKSIYDFYIPDKNIIIEVHGAQHYIRQIHYNARTVEEEQENDAYKKKLAISNGFTDDKYIVINACNSDFEYIKNSILDSNLSKYYDLSVVNWDKVYIDSIHSLVVKASNLWSNNYTTSQIATYLKKNVRSIISLLKTGKKIGLCDYTPEKSNKKRDNSRMKKIICLENMITYLGIQECSKCINVSANIIKHCCYNDGSHEINGKHYFYINDINTMSVENIAEILLKPNHGGNNGCVVPIYCIESNMIFQTKKDATVWCGVKKHNILKNIRNECDYAGIHPITKEKLHWREATIKDVISVYSLIEKKNKLKELKYA